MPSLHDSDLNKHTDVTIRWSCNVECPECSTVQDVEFDTGATDQDGLADLDPGELEQPVKCPNCDHEWSAAYEGWVSYGEAG